MHNTVEVGQKIRIFCQVIIVYVLTFQEAKPSSSLINYDFLVGQKIEMLPVGVISDCLFMS